MCRYISEKEIVIQNQAVHMEKLFAKLFRH
jgi:hypothetical protein